MAFMRLLLTSVLIGVCNNFKFVNLKFSDGPKDFHILVISTVFVMYKFYNEVEALQDDIVHARNLQGIKKKLAEQMQQKIALNSMTSEPTIVKDNFNSHPRNCSGSDSTILNSPRKNVHSYTSNIDLELENLSRISKVVPKSSRKKRNKRTNEDHHPCEPFQIDVDIGDSSPNTPKNSFNADECQPELKILYSRFQEKDQFQKNIAISDSTFDRKFKSFVEKSLQSIADIRNLMDKGIEPPDGEEDISRRMLRVKEFANRFSRNYLYPLVRQIDELSKWKSAHPGSNQKLLSAYQVIFNGLQAYQNHLPTSIGTCSSDKLKLLMKHLLDLCDIHHKILPEGDVNGHKKYLVSFKLSAEVTLKHVDDLFTMYSGKATTIKLSNSQCRSNFKLAKQKKPKNNLEQRLYMYNTTCSFRKDMLWKKAAEALAKDKNRNVKSRYRTAGFKHRPPVPPVKTEIFSAPESQSKLSTKKSKDICKNENPYDENTDDKTVKNYEIDEKQDVNKEEEIVVKLLQMILDINSSNNDNNEENLKRTRDVEKIMEIVDKIKEGVEFESLKDVLKELQSGNPRKETLELKIIQNSESVPESLTKQKKPPIVTVSGTKNAKLICIQDDNSIVTDDEDVKEDSTEKAIPVKAPSSHNQTNIEKETKISHKPSTSLTVKRSSKSLKHLQMLPKDYAVNIIQYKLNFSKSSTKNPMYKRTTKILPWVMMANLSDEILNVVLLGVAKEVEISEVVEKMYQSELQFC